MNGGVSGTNSFSLNGAPISLTGSWQVAPNVDAIQEFKVMTNTYDAAMGRTGGGSVNTTLKAGTNQWHGTMFDFVRNSLFDANYTQNKQVNAGRGKHITHQYGGTIGGALRKNSDFVFVSFEGFKELVPFPVVANVPPMDLRDGQHFSNYGWKIYDPLTVHNCVNSVDVAGNCGNTTYIRSPFPGNVLPKSRINPIGEKLLSYYPAPNAPGLAQNFVYANSTGKYHYEQPIARYDRVISDKDRFFFTGTFQHGREYRNQNGIPGAAAAGNIGSQRTNFNTIANYTRIVSPSAIFDVRLSFGRFTAYFPDGEVDSGVTAKDLGINKLTTAPTSTNQFPPRFTVDQFADLFGNGANIYTWGTDNQWNLAPTMTVTKRKMTLKYGVDLVYAMRGSGNVGQTNGQFSFNRSITRQNPLLGGNNTDGAGIADLLLGAPGSGFADWNDTYYRTWPYAGVFIQNDWKVARHLTLNLGLRYDVQFPFVERWDRLNAGFDFNTKSPVSDAVLAQWKTNEAAYNANKANVFPYPPAPDAILGGKTFVTSKGPRRTYDTDWTNIQPRIGVAWAFHKTSVLRGGFGVFHRTATQSGYTDGFSQQTVYQASLDGGITSAALQGSSSAPYSLQNPFPDGLVAPSGSKLGLLTNAGNGVSFDGHQRPIPTNYQYSFGIQHRSIWNTLFDVSYVGSVTNHESMSYNSDYLPLDVFLKAQQTNSFLTRTVNNPFYNILPRNTTFGAGPTMSAQALYYPYPLFNGITISTNPWTRYRYDALQIRVEKRFGGDRRQGGALTMVFSYTFSKNFQDANRLNNWNLTEKPIHEVVGYDKPQNISYTGVWDLPFGKGRHFAAAAPKMVDRVIGGWTINWIYRFTSGNPVGGIDVVSSCPDLLLDNQRHDQWFNNNRNCYKSRPNFTLRNVPDRYGWLRQMDNLTVNLAGAKTFAITERWKFNLRAEAFNLFNHPLYGAPDTGFQNVRFGMLPLGQQNFPRLIQISGKILF